MNNFKADKIDHSSLQPLSKNDSKNNKIIAKDSEVCKTNINIFSKNIQNFLLSTDVCECSSLLISENNWFYRKGNIKYKGKNSVDLDLHVGQLIQVDLGKNYDVESGLIHYGLILKILKDKVLIIPMTTAKKQIDVAYHPIENKSGKFHLRKGNISEGFTKTVALYINDIKCVSIGRLLPYKNVDIIEQSAYNNIKEHVLRFYFADMFKEIDKNIKQIKNENEQLKKEITKLQENIDNKT